MNMSAMFQLHPPYSFWGKDFLIFFRKFLFMLPKIYSLCCHGNQSNSAISTKFIWIIEDYSRNISVKNLNTCSETAKIANFHFNHYSCKSMETVAILASRVLIRLEQKTQLFVPPAYRCYIWSLVRIGFIASEEMSFENVDGRGMPAYTISSSMSIRLRWANNVSSFYIWNFKPLASLCDCYNKHISYVTLHMNFYSEKPIFKNINNFNEINMSNHSRICKSSCSHKPLRFYNWKEFCSLWGTCNGWNGAVYSAVVLVFVWMKSKIQKLCSDTHKSDVWQIAQLSNDIYLYYLSFDR